MNNAAMNIYIHVFVQIYIFSFLGYIPRSIIPESFGNCIFNLFAGEQYSDSVIHTQVSVFKFFSHLSYCRIFSRAPCAIQ